MRRFLLIAAVAALAVAGCSAAGNTATSGSPVGAVPLLTASGAADPTAVGARTVDTERTSITTVGTGKVRGTPDVLTIGLGVETRAASATEALQQNNVLTADVITVLKDSGVVPADLQTSQLWVNPTYDDKNVISGYQVVNSVTATLRNIAAAGAVIDAVAQRAGNAARVAQLSFSIGDDTVLRAAARADAVKQAQTQAKQLADAAGVPLGAIRSITESSSASPPQYYAASADAAAGASVPVEPGSQELTVVVQVVYDIG